MVQWCLGDGRSVMDARRMAVLSGAVAAFVAGLVLLVYFMGLPSTVPRSGKPGWPIDGDDGVWPIGRPSCSRSIWMKSTPPATLFEVTLGKTGSEDFYDVSLVDGYNLPVVAIPRALRGQGACNATGCMADLNRSCPRELQVDCGAGAIACRSACEAFGQDRYCCSGAYGTPAACRPTAYSSIFKTACPRAYSYAYDDSTSTFTCNADDYNVAFCLPTSGIKESDAVLLGAQIDGVNARPLYANGGQSTGEDNAPPSHGNGGAGAPVYDNYGGAYEPPIYNYGRGGAHVPPAMRASSAGTRIIRPWLLLVLLVCFP